MPRTVNSWTFRYIAVFVQRGQKVEVTMERDHRYRDAQQNCEMLERIPAGVITLSPVEWQKLVELLTNTPMPDGFEYEVHEQ